ncbi:MAG: siphovirus ReqiPepy6 Gp37-like family protein [Lachnospiraceae bacterium]|nr:siphovirus ReqiPepy6 Gp37-like family protein [Lachnospiraceae bacterium]
MVVIYTDGLKRPCGVLKKYKVDLDIGAENDFEITMHTVHHCMEYGSIWYVDGTEYGGIVDDIKIDTDSGKVSYTGRAWRGILAKKIIEPDDGEDYLTVNGEANGILAELIDRLDVADMFQASGVDSGITITSHQFERYCTGIDGITKMLASVGARLQLVMSEDSGLVVLSAVEAEDLSETYEYSDDYGMKLIMNEVHSGVNHLICLGQGDLAERTVIHLYVDANGNVGDTQYYTGIQEIAETYEYTSAEDEDDLIDAGADKLESLKSANALSATLGKTDVDVNIGDIVGGKNRATGIQMTCTVASKIVKIENDQLTVTYEVED